VEHYESKRDFFEPKARKNPLTCQYYAKDFLGLTKDLGIKNCRCEYPCEKGKAERINGVIKNNYFKNRKINNYVELGKRSLPKCVTL